MPEGTRVTIDRDECVSCSVCWSTCPEFFEENPDDSHSQVVAKYRENDDPALGLCPDDLLASVQDAADGCPVEIINVAE